MTILPLINQPQDLNPPKNILQKAFLCAKVLSKAPEISIDF